MRKREIKNQILTTYHEFIDAQITDNISYLDQYNHRILEAYSKIEKITGSVSESQEFRATEILKLLEKYQPSSVIEFGSGRSSIIFSAYKAKNGLKHIAYEQHSSWAKIVNDLSYEIANKVCAVETPVKPWGDMGITYDIPNYEYADMIYVDGPAGARKNQISYNTPKGHPIYGNIIDYLAQGLKPKIIVFDGRLETVRHLSNSFLSQGYVIKQQVQFAIHQGNYEQAREFNRHTLFIRSDLTSA